MTTKIEAIAASTQRTIAIHHESAWITIACAEMLNRFMARGRFLALIVLCASSLLAAPTAQAQEPVGERLAATSAELATRSYPLGASESAVAPHLVLSMAEPNQFRFSDSLPTAAGQPNAQRPTQRMGSSILKSGSFSLAPAANEAKSGSAANNTLDPESILSAAEAKYMRWESSLADSRSLTIANGAPVYPLAQINYGDWHLPVTLNTSAAPGSETRW